MNSGAISLVIFSCLAASARGCYSGLVPTNCGSDYPQVSSYDCGAQYVANVLPTYGSDVAVGDVSNYPSAVLATSAVAPSVAAYNSYASGPGYVDVNPVGLTLPGSIECGPGVAPLPIRSLPPVVLPPVNERIQELETPPLPPPTVISNRCRCTKVVQKPQLYQRVIQVQRNQRFLKKTIIPRVERVSYCAKPRC